MVGQCLSRPGVKEIETCRFYSGATWELRGPSGLDRGGQPSATWSWGPLSHSVSESVEEVSRKSLLTIESPERRELPWSAL